MPRFSVNSCSRKKDFRSEREEIVGFHVVDFSLSSFCVVENSWLVTGDAVCRTWKQCVVWSNVVKSRASSAEGLPADDDNAENIGR